MQLEDIIRAAGIGQLLLVESALGARGLAPRGAAGRLWTLVCLIGPLPLCFHAPFIRGVVLPLALGSPGS